MRVLTNFMTLALGVGCLLSFVGCNRDPHPGDPGLMAVATAMNQGIGAMGQYDYDAAVTAFEAALREKPELVDAKINLAIARFNRARKEDLDPEATVGLLDDVLKREPKNVRALYFKGIVLQHFGKADLAVSCFEQVVEQKPDDGVAWYLLGMCKQRLGQPCERELLRAIESRPYLASAYYKLWQVLQASGETAKGQPYLEKFKQLRQSPLIETVELAQYNQMGELAQARPLPPQNTVSVTRSLYAFKAASPVFEGRNSSGKEPETESFSGAVIIPSATNSADASSQVILLPRSSTKDSGLIVLQKQSTANFVDCTEASGLSDVKGAVSCAAGDIDNDGHTDLFLTCQGGNNLFLGKGEGQFADVTEQSGVRGQANGARSAVLLDADHDGDLDILVCNPGPTGNQLWNNNSDGTFADIAATAAIRCQDAGCKLALAGDLDGDRDSDLVFLCETGPAKVFLNDLLGSYHEANLGGLDVRGECGGVLQDFDGDGQLDLLALGGTPRRMKLFTGAPRTVFRPAPEFTKVSDAAGSWGVIRSFRVSDLDLDGDLDVILFSDGIHLLLNNGAGVFVLQPNVGRGGLDLSGAEVADFNGDLIPDVLCIERAAENRAHLLPGELTPPSTALSLWLTGIRERDKRTRSPATPYGTQLTTRTSLKQQFRLFTGQMGGLNQSPLPIVVGLSGAPRADYVQIRWPDGVTQVETSILNGQHQAISEVERKVSSCPVLFTWNGSRFEFVTDFAGVGGLGYFISPGEYAQPQVLEHVKIEPNQLRPNGKSYELRITEPMEETAYVDKLELLAIDHPSDWLVFPDERLAVNGPPPTHQLLVIERPIFPRRAFGPDRRVCTNELLKVDRLYAYEPLLDRRFVGFCRPHTLELDFGEQLVGLSSTARIFLFINGYLEYPYSQTTYAAGQARLGWEPIRVERRLPDGTWKTIVPDAGAFGGMSRTMTIDLTRLLNGPDCRLRLTSNLEMYYDQVFLAQVASANTVTTRVLKVASAELRRLGFPREFSPDGRLPLIYDYDLRDITAPFHVLRGRYTRYGPVTDLLKDFDDRYVLVGPGDEIALRFDAWPETKAGMARSFILISHAYCKDMDLYTAAAQTLEPLPFREMSHYPYPRTERYPENPELIRYHETYNTRLQE